MNRSAILAMLFIIGSFVACSEESPAPAPSVKDSCHAPKIYVTAYNQCLNRESCPEGQGWLPSESRCISSDATPTPTPDSTTKTYRYSAIMNISDPKILQNFMKSVGLCSESPLAWCWPNKCPQDCEAWTGAWLYIEVAKEVSTDTNTQQSLVTILPQQSYYSYGMPIQAYGNYIKLESGFKLEGTITSYVPGASGPLVVEVPSGTLGASHLQSTVYVRGTTLGTAYLSTY